MLFFLVEIWELASGGIKKKMLAVWLYREKRHVMNCGSSKFRTCYEFLVASKRRKDM